MQGERKHVRLRLLGLAVAGFVLAVAAVGCGSSEPAEGTEAAAAEATATTQAQPINWTPESDCSMCHTAEAASLDDPACLASAHASVGVTCTTCHADAEGLSAAHSRVTFDMTDGGSALVATSVDISVCAGCHDTTALAAITAASTVLIDDNGTTANPHALPANAEHSEFDCTSCHKVHSTTPLETTAMRTCTSCHHAFVFECGTCHAAE